MYIELTHCSCYISSSYLVGSPLMWVGQAPHIIHTSDTITQSPSHTYRYSPAHTPQPLTAHKDTHIHTRRYTAVQVNTKWYSTVNSRAMNDPFQRHVLSSQTHKPLLYWMETLANGWMITEWMDEVNGQILALPRTRVLRVALSPSSEPGSTLNQRTVPCAINIDHYGSGATSHLGAPDPTSI